MRLLTAGLVYFALVFGAGCVLGAVRVTFLVPRLGERMAELLEMPVMLVVVIFAARLVLRRFALSTSIGPPLAVGAIGLALLIAAELMLAVGLQDRSISQYIASRDPISGSVYLAMLALYAATPCLLAWLSRTNVRPPAKGV
jgi:hypothetical protein